MLQRFRYVFALVVAAALLGTVVGCTRVPTPVPGATETKPAATKVTAVEDSGEASPTAEFKVELPVSATPTQEPVDGTPAPTNTPGPTKTPRPTKTPWPTRAPTSAPVDDENMVYVEGGEFVFGSDAFAEDESPAQTIEVDGYNIDRYPVTNAEYKAFVDATGHRAPRHWKEGVIPAGTEDHPVVWVTWDDAQAYAEWVGKRLPTEIEWEKAARGTDGRTYPWGDDFDATKANSREAGIGGTSPVGQFTDGASPSGALDMAGNVWEWTADWYQPYRGSLYQMERYGETHKVLRGGSWFDGSDQVRTTVRNSVKPDFYFSTIGFRCAQ